MNERHVMDEKIFAKEVSKNDGPHDNDLHPSTLTPPPTYQIIRSSQNLLLKSCYN